GTVCTGSGPGRSAASGLADAADAGDSAYRLHVHIAVWRNSETAHRHNGRAVIHLSDCGHTCGLDRFRAQLAMDAMAGCGRHIACSRCHAARLGLEACRTRVLVCGLTTYLRHLAQPKIP